MERKTILLVEDDPGDVKLALHAFKRFNIASHVRVVCDGAEALEFLHHTGRYAAAGDEPPPTLVLLDLKLPKVDGIEVLRRMRAHARTRRVPVVVLTSSREEQDLRACYMNGANSYVRKPVDFDEFTETARHLGRYWLSLNEVAPAV